MTMVTATVATVTMELEVEKAATMDPLDFPPDPLVLFEVGVTPFVKSAPHLAWTSVWMTFAHFKTSAFNEALF